MGALVPRSYPWKCKSCFSLAGMADVAGRAEGGVAEKGLLAQNLQVAELLLHTSEGCRAHAAASAPHPAPPRQLLPYIKQGRYVATSQAMDLTLTPVTAVPALTTYTGVSFSFGGVFK